MDDTNYTNQLQVVAWDNESTSPSQEEIDSILDYSLNRTRVQERNNTTIWQPHLEENCDVFKFLNTGAGNFHWEGFETTKTIWWLMHPVEKELLDQYSLSETNIHISERFIKGFINLIEGITTDSGTYKHFYKNFGGNYQRILKEVFPGMFMQLQDVKQCFMDQGYFVSLNSRIFTEPQRFNQYFKEYFETDMLPVCMMSIGTKPKIFKHKTNVEILRNDNGSKITFSKDFYLDKQLSVALNYPELFSLSRTEYKTIRRAYRDIKDNNTIRTEVAMVDGEPQIVNDSTTYYFYDADNNSLGKELDFEDKKKWLNF